MGVTGTGKSTVGRLIASRLGVAYAEGDSLHSPQNVAKMASGTPLTDEDRWPWLDRVGEWCAAASREGVGGVISCSALKRVYRDRLRSAAPGLVFVHLAGSRELIGARQEARVGHFMPGSLVDSQFATLEPLGSDEVGVVVDVAPAPEEIVAVVVGALRDV
ncbi:gluconokinase [Streptomyces sp. NBC_01304]|uniref:gluconokinase n=1 Tax=Streptomyces sp. NBC_01304 TaxID=2903818 RepID=UPI003FA3AB12